LSGRKIDSLHCHSHPNGFLAPPARDVNLPQRLNPPQPAENIPPKSFPKFADYFPLPAHTQFMIRFHNLDQTKLSLGQNRLLAYCSGSSRKSKNKRSDFPAPSSVQIDVNSFAINTNLQKSRPNFVEFVGFLAIFSAKTTPIRPKPIHRYVKTES